MFAEENATDLYELRIDQGEFNLIASPSATITRALLGW